MINENSLTELEGLKKQLELEDMERGADIQRKRSETERHLIERAHNKELFSIDDQITYLRLKGIRIESTDEADVREILMNRSCYFKITAYRKNFEQDTSKKYIGATFMELADLAKLDMYLRMILSGMIFELEHVLKTRLIQYITEDDSIDGYEIVVNFNEYMKDKFIKNQQKKCSRQSIEQLVKNYKLTSENIMNNLSRSDYDRDLFKGHAEKPSIWVLLEVMSLGSLGHFIQYYCEKSLYKYTSLKAANKMIRFVANVRNASAHSRPLIYNVVEPYQYGLKKLTRNRTTLKQPAPQLRQYALDAGIAKETISPILTNKKMNDIVAVLYLHDKYVVSGNFRQKRKTDLDEFIERCKRDGNLYVDAKDLKKSFYFFEKIVKYYGSK